MSYRVGKSAFLRVVCPKLTALNKKINMTKKEWMKRAETIFEMGLIKSDLLSLLRSALEAFVRLRSVYANHPEMFDEIKKEYQGEIAINELTQYDTLHYLDKKKVLANDRAYNALRITAVIDHPCQKCAEDKNAWHTRYGFCNHKRRGK